VWSPILEKSDRALARWELTHPTQEGKRLIITMVIGGYTQYMTRVQGMPKEVEALFTKKIQHFMSGGEGIPMISLDVMHSSIKIGGKKLLHVVARNQAIELMKMKSYLTINEECPKWAFIADVLISNNIPAGCHVKDDLSKSNPFLQSWRANITSSKTTLPVIQDWKVMPRGHSQTVVYS